MWSLPNLTPPQAWREGALFIEKLSRREMSSCLQQSWEQRWKDQWPREQFRRGPNQKLPFEFIPRKYPFKKKALLPIKWNCGDFRTQPVISKFLAVAPPSKKKNVIIVETGWSIYGFIILFSLLVCMFEIFHDKYF